MEWTSFILVSIIGTCLAKIPELKPEGLRSIEKNVNDSFIASCSAQGEEVYWSGPGERSIPVRTGRVHTEVLGGKIYTLIFDRIETSDQGRYTCSSLSKDSVSFDLKVIRTPKFKNTPSSRDVTEYQNTFIPCEAEGEPKPTISWSRLGQSIDDIGDKRFSQEPNGLRLKNATRKDSGVYSCRAIQVGFAESSITTTDITLNVHHKPEWKDRVSGAQNVYGYLMGEANISCEAAAFPEAEYSWLKNNKDVRSLNMNATVVAEPGRSVLQFPITSVTVYGPYQCQARNKLGSISRMFELKKGEKPDPPTGLQVVETTYNNATLHLEGGGGPGNDSRALLGYRVQFVITRPGESANWTLPHYQDITKNNEGQYVLIDLLEDTPYTARAAARGPAGLSDYTNATIVLRTKRVGELSSSTRNDPIWMWMMTLLAASLAGLTYGH